jgi:hypothetical protein
MNSNIELAKPRDFGEIINDTFTFIRQNFKPLLKYFFIFCGFFMLVNAALTVLIEVRAFSFVTSVNPNGFEDPNGLSKMFSLMGNYLVLFVFIILEQIAVNVTVLSFMTLYKQKQNTIPTTEEMWGYFKFYYLKILGSSVLLYIIITFGMVFCLVPGIYLAVVLALVPPIMVMENTTFGYAFSHSFKLIKDNWWVTFGVFVVVYIVIYVASLAVTIPSMILGAGNVFLHLKDGKAVSLPLAILTAVLQTFQYALYMLMIVAICLCYFNLTESKEGTGLLARINQFGTAENNTDQGQEEY